MIAGVRPRSPAIFSSKCNLNQKNWRVLPKNAGLLFYLKVRNTYMFRKHFNMKLSLLFMFFVAAGVVYIFSAQPTLEREGIYFSRNPFIFCIMLLQLGLTIALIAVNYRYWHARVGNPLSYLRALGDISLVAMPVFLYLVLGIILQISFPNLQADVITLFFVPLGVPSVFYHFFQMISGTANYQMTGLGNFFVGFFVLTISLAILLFRSRKISHKSHKLMLPVIITSYLIALLAAVFHPIALKEISGFFF